MQNPAPLTILSVPPRNVDPVHGHTAWGMVGDDGCSVVFFGKTFPIPAEHGMRTPGAREEFHTELRQGEFCFIPVAKVDDSYWGRQYLKTDPLQRGIRNGCESI